MKRVITFVVLSASVLFADYDDGFITAGEYEYGAVIWQSYDPPLIVNGGGAEQISVGENGRLIVESTSTPLKPWWDPNPGGVYDILLFDTSHLLYLDGVTELIDVGANGLIYSTAELRGGSINYIRSMAYPVKTGVGPGIDLYAQPGWSWINEDPMQGIEGNWLDDGSPFRIEFINMTDDGYDPVYENIEVITPEPATFVLLAVGGMLLKRRKH